MHFGHYYVPGGLFVRANGQSCMDAMRTRVTCAHAQIIAIIAQVEYTASSLDSVIVFILLG